LVVAAVEAARRLALPGLDRRLEPLATHPSATVRSVVSPGLRAGRPGDDRLVGAHPADATDLLSGGDAVRGERWFAEKADWGCQRCHKLRGNGGDVGPELTGVGRRLGREQLLESILHPNRRIAAGYETVVLTLGDGETRAGIVRDEQNGMVRLQTAAEGEFQIPAARIRGRDRAASAMPEGLGELMTRGELRDLIEALSR
jgi:quinoprotein glucose dehydrogenase